MTYKSEEDKLWCELFKIALGARAGIATAPNAQAVVDDAAQIADRALVTVAQHLAEPVQPDASAELFGPMLQQRAAKQKKDDDDSGFAVAR